MGAVKHRDDLDPHAIVAVKNALATEVDFADTWVVEFFNDSAGFREFTKPACVLSQAAYERFGRSWGA